LDQCGVEPFVEALRRLIFFALGGMWLASTHVRSPDLV
jgi:hypothetical protein